MSCFVLIIHYLCGYRNSLLFTIKLFNMRKITLLLLLVVGSFVVNAQELVVNGGFENWTDSKPDSWTLTTASGQSFTKESTIVKSGTASLKSAHTGTSGTAKIVITTKINVTEGSTYRLSFWYYVDASTTNTTSAFRNWGYWNNPDGSQGTFDQLNLQMGDASSYIPTDVTGQWLNRSIDVTAPTGSGTVQLELRFYKASTIYVDDVSFTNITTGVSNPESNNFTVYISDRNLNINGITEGSSIEIYSALGSKVKSAVVENSKVDISNLSKGLYIVRSNNLSQKFIIR